MKVSNGKGRDTLHIPLSEAPGPVEPAADFNPASPLSFLITCYTNSKELLPRPAS